MQRWFCIWNDLANPKIALNLVKNQLITRSLAESKKIPHKFSNEI